MQLSVDKKGQAPLEITVYICSLCKNNFPDNNSIVNHMVTAHGNEKHIKFLQTNNLKTCTNNSKKNLRKVRMYNKIFKCNECSYTTLHMTTYKRHTLTHQKGKLAPSSRCPHCPYCAVQPYNLKLHIKNMHPNGGVDPIDVIGPSKDLISDMLKKYTSNV